MWFSACKVRLSSGACSRDNVCWNSREGQKASRFSRDLTILRALTQACSSTALRLRLAASLVFPTTCLEELEQVFTNRSFDKRERGIQQDVEQVTVRRDACLLLCRQS